MLGVMKAELPRVWTLIMLVARVGWTSSVRREKVPLRLRLLPSRSRYNVLDGGIEERGDKKILSSDPADRPLRRVK